MVLDREKIDVIRNWLMPRSASEVRSFLGWGNYFKKSVQDPDITPDWVD